jgi:hypothetical protein
LSERPPPEDLAREARRQSLGVSGRASEQDALECIDRAAADQSWQ